MSAPDAQASEPAWIEHDGSDVCPVPAGHDVEALLTGGGKRRAVAGQLLWGDLPGDDYRITHYRDWTAFAQASEGAVGEWAVDRALERFPNPRFIDGTSWKQAVMEGRDALHANSVRFLASQIEEYEPKPADPLEDAVGDMLDFWDNHTAADGDAFGKCVAMLRARLPAVAVAAVEGATDV